MRTAAHLSALLEVGAGVPAAEVAEHVGVSPSTVYRWLQAFIVQHRDSLRYGTAPGRPCQLPPTQKACLKALVAAGSLAAGYPTGCCLAHCLPGADALDRNGEAGGGTLALRPDEGLVVELA